MINVLQMTKRLETAPSLAPVDGVAVRTFLPENVAAWLALRDRAFARERVGVRAWSEADFRGEFLDRWWWRPQWMWLAEHAESDRTAELVGSVTLAMRGSEEAARPVVHWLIVAPRWRRRGVGRLLLSNLERAAWEAGHHEIWLETHAQWEAAVKFYEALGYRVVL
jgi:GNAT superfamily N-acetyltransferase